MTLPQLFDLTFESRRAAVAVEWDRSTYTFGEIDARAARTAHVLASRGLRAGDRLCVYLANRIEYIDLFLAAMRLGIIFVPINILYRDREIRHIVNDADPVAVAVSRETAGHVPEGPTLWFIEEMNSSDMAKATVTDGDTPAAIIYTSGTTGTSKGAIITHNMLAVNAINIVTCWQIASADRFLLTLPLFHVHGLGNGICAWLLSGCLMRLEERFDQHTAAKLMLEFQPTLFFGVPTMYVRMLSFDEADARAIGVRMRLFVSGSAPLASQVLEDFRRLYGHTILERYGMSETLMSISNPYVGERRAGSVGLPLPGVSVRIIDGEIQLRGANVFPGYWRRPDATSAAFHDGWFRTGDLAICEPDGYYTLQGRRSDLIISGGFNIYPREIEEFLMEQPGVAEAAVAGVPDSARGEIPVAWIVGDCSAEELERACRENLASFKVPRRFVSVQSLPRTALGKIQKHLLPK